MANAHHKYPDAEVPMLEAHQTTGGYRMAQQTQVGGKAADNQAAGSE